MRDWIDSQLDALDPARPLALVRIALGLCLMAQGCEFTYHLARLANADAFRLPWLAALPLPQRSALWAALAAWLLASCAFTAGTRTRFAGATLLAGFAYVFAADIQLQSHHAYFIALCTLLLVVGDSAAIFSGDAATRGAREWVAAWPATLLRCQISFVYAYAATAKVDPAWLRDGPIGRFVALPTSLRVPALFLALGVATVLVEAFLAFGLWTRRTRPLAFVTGLAFHTAIPLTMAPRSSLLVFSIATLAPYILFLDARPASRRVAYDPTSARQARWAARCARLDWLALFRFEPVAGARWEVSGPDGSWHGRRGLIAVLEGLPVSFLWAPALRWIPALARH